MLHGVEWFACPVPGNGKKSGYPTVQDVEVLRQENTLIVILVTLQYNDFLNLTTNNKLALVCFILKVSLRENHQKQQKET